MPSMAVNKPVKKSFAGAEDNVNYSPIQELIRWVNDAAN